MRKGCIAILSILIIVLMLGLGFYLNKPTYSYVLKSNEAKIKSNNIAIMLEADDGSWVQSDESAWPTSYYIYNSNLTYCEKGGKPQFDGDTNSISLNTSISDKCYIYFDKGPSFAEILIAKVGEPAGNDNEVFLKHDSNLANGAQDDSYRYSGNNPNNFVCFGAGSEKYYSGEIQACPDKNIYRIIGAFKNDSEQYEVKLIKSEYITKEELGIGTNTYGDSSSALTLYNEVNYTPRVKNISEINGFKWNTTKYDSWTEGTSTSSNKYNLWEYVEQKATLNEALNKVVETPNENNKNGYLGNLGTNWSSKIADTTWYIGGTSASSPKEMYNQEMNTEGSGLYQAPQTTSRAKIGLMYLSDYGFAAKNVNDLWNKNINSYNNDDNLQNNWMYNGVNEWTISRFYGSVRGTYYVSNSGSISSSDVSSSIYGVRPVFYLNSNVSYVSGDGSFESPYVIN